MSVTIAGFMVKDSPIEYICNSLIKVHFSFSKNTKVEKIIWLFIEKCEQVTLCIFKMLKYNCVMKIAVSNLVSVLFQEYFVIDVWCLKMWQICKAIHVHIKLMLEQIQWLWALI